ncbi:MAG: Coenzyme F420 hydrogenase/dehydrogenase, beta subunit C-terminal domain [Paludibacteraceae bacterium]|nr:Coenzyme F420 hydrogenase/dehydrogenase, beta subunit C-terminal domain [Paludibacteraceae bacterium]
MENRYVWDTKERCSGCGVCALKCGHKAITMSSDDEGFIYPQIDSEKCVDCGLCRSVCHEGNDEVLNRRNHRYFGCMLNEKQLLLKSSSGGAFTALCRAMDVNAVISGCAFDENLHAHHICVSNNEDNINRLRKSKYVQSNLNGVFSEIQQCLNENKKVLFTGTACQVAALYSYLRGKPENLFTVDLICHGVPNQLVFNSYLSSLENKFKIKINKYSFREKQHFLHDWEIGVRFGNDKKMIYRAWGEDCYMTGFLRGLFYRRGCYSCRYSNRDKYRPADITIADFWGSESVDKRFNSKKGSSLIITNSEKGELLVSSIKSGTLLLETTEELAINHNPNFTSPTKWNDRREEFFSLYKSGKDFDSIIRSMFKGPRSHSQKIRVLMELLFPWLVKLRRKRIIKERNKR